MLEMKLNKYFDKTGTLNTKTLSEFTELNKIDFMAVDTPNRTAMFKPELIIIHYTAGGAMCGTVDWLSREDSHASYHFIIDRDGSICQMVSVFERAWHAGLSNYQNHREINPISFGIGLCNWGPLSLHKSGKYYIPFINGNDIPRIEPQYVEDHKPLNPECIFTHWESYRKPQLFSLGILLFMLASEFEIMDLLQHSDIASSRKIDPGPAFPYDPFRLFTNIVSRR